MGGWPVGGRLPHIQALIRDATAGNWWSFTDPSTILEALRPADVPGILDEVEAMARQRHQYVVGFVTYEAATGLDEKLPVHGPGALPPAWFAAFDAAKPAPVPAGSGPSPLTWEPSVDATTYREALARIRTYLAAGDAYQVNYSYRLRASLEPGRALDSHRLFHAMLARQPDGLGAFIENDHWAVCSASHELFFLRRGNWLTSRPMKGTVARGATAAEDAQRAAWLRASSKNRAENLMITDMVRNDIGRLAMPGSVRTESLFHLEAYPTLWQMTSTVHGETRASLRRIFQALFPAASITGAPKRRTMQIIRELESERREIYTGTVGMVRPGGDAQFNVAIRTAFVDKRAFRAEYGVGGGIVWDSDPDEEHRETLTKATILAPAPPPVFCLLETLLWDPHDGWWFLAEHLCRMQQAARHFFSRGLDESIIRARLAEAVADVDRLPHRVRLLVGEMDSVRVDAVPLADGDAPRRVALVRPPVRLVGNPLVLHKTTRRDVYETARQLLPEGGAADEALLINEHGEVTEATIANLVVDLDGTLVTPPVSAGLLAGIYRQHLLDSGRVVEQSLRPEDLVGARGVYLANSVRGLWRVTLVS